MEPTEQASPIPAERATGDTDRTQRITRGLVEAGVALTSALSMERVLQILADVARDLVGARYAALGVINAEGTALSEFITSGLTPEQRARLGDLPTGHGILGLLIRDARPVRLRDLREHPASAGVPKHHPTMRSFLGVPVMAKGRVFGNLYVTDKIGADEFSDEDLAIIEMLASQAAVAIENAQLRRERDRFFATASHELGNAIAGVRLWSRRLIKRPPESMDDWIDGVQQIFRGADHAQRLIEDLLSLARIQEGRLELGIEEIDLVSVARSTVAELRPEAEAAELRLELVAAPTPCTVSADSARVRQILVNLLSNAVKFTPAGRMIRVGFDEPAADFVVAWVRDEGPGIAREDVERIFHPYEQVGGVAAGRGAGLGLPLSRQLARLMGGDLWVESVPGAGSTFRLRLPVRAREW